MTPHPPQLCGSVSMSTHLLWQGVKGAPHPKPHVEAAHVGTPPGGDWHALSQVPQCIGSLVRSAHEPVQSVRPPVHPPVLHTPVAQTSPELHTVGQAPQWLGSDERLTHRPLQSSEPLGHAYPHLPAAQVATAPDGGLQTLAQAPQLKTSSSVGMQSPLHFVKPEAH
jgi:hypothetical protein